MGENDDASSCAAAAVSRAGTHPRLGSSRVAVIGGGIGGLACALALQADGALVEVFERDEAFDDRKQGYGLTLTNNAVGPLAKLGILGLVAAHDAARSPSVRHWIFSPHGGLLGFYGNDFFAGGGSGEGGGGVGGGDGGGDEDGGGGGDGVAFKRGNLRIPRQSLRQALLDRLAPGTVKWGKRLAAIEVAAPPAAGSGSHGGDSSGEASGGGIGSSSSGGGGDGGGALVRFSDGSSVRAVLVVGADGVRSAVRDELEPSNPPS